MHGLEIEFSRALREKCLNTEFFSGPYFPVFSPNTGKQGPGKSSVFGYFSRSGGKCFDKGVKEIYN